MTQQRIHITRCIAFLAVLLTGLLASAGLQAQCQWGITATATSSTCPANGEIVARLTGPDTAAVKGNMLYSLEPLTSGGFSVSPNTSNVFENVPPGGYRVIAQSTCGGEAVSASAQVTVEGSYRPFSATVAKRRDVLNTCILNNGQATVQLNGGNTPYNIVLTGVPDAYTGPREIFVGEAWNFVLDSLNKGTYTLSIRDACGTTLAPQTVTIGERVLTSDDFLVYAAKASENNCDSILISSPQVYFSASQYFTQGQEFTYTYSFDGATPLPYRKIGVAHDPIIPPEGKRLKDLYRKTVTFYIKPPCGGNVITVSRTIDVPSTSGLSFAANCETGFDAFYSIYNYSGICYPVYASLKNNSTGAYRYDTVRGTSSNYGRVFRNMPYGAYTFTLTTDDGYLIYENTNWVADPPPDNPYTISKFPNDGLAGNDGAAYFRIHKSTGSFTAGTTVTLLNHPDYTYSLTVSEGAGNYLYIYSPTSSRYRYFYPGTYRFRITDACGSNDLDITVEEKDVYRYNWTYTQVQTCEGLKITPTGTCSYNNTTRNVYFGILATPWEYWGSTTQTVPSGSSLVLPTPGEYLVGVSSFFALVGNYSYYNYPVNTKTIDYIHKPLGVDVNRSLGWVCPGQPANSGSIVAVAVGGSTAATGVYKYKLALEGNGTTGPYLDSNTTGRFTPIASGAAYRLMTNQNYDVRVEDECGAAVTQTLKIIDFATAQVASSDKEQYCLGDAIRFRIINLPTTAVTYAWTGPDGFTSNQQNPVLDPVKATSGGNYHVVINSDICSQPIEADVNITIAPYIASCYSAVTDTSVNPYAYGLLGNWRPSRSYTYYGPRAQSDPAQGTNIRTDGAFSDFAAFWQAQTAGWSATPDTTKWVWNTESTIFNPKGFELENKDALGRYTTALYGYDDAIPVAVVQNSRYREAAFEGFEDYGFGNNSCAEACMTDRRFDFSRFRDKIDSTQKHTGKYSIRVLSTDTVGIKSLVTAAATDPAAPAFNMGSNACSPAQVLKSVRANSSVLLPAFSPMAGKKVLVSAWVKEEQDCKCTSYTGNRIQIAVTAPSGDITVMAKPAGGIIEGWQRYEQVVDLPADANSLSVVLQATGSTAVYFDDIRVHPYNANMKSFVYDPQNLRLMAELDENNYATFYEYDDDGTLTRLKKETERGVKTIQETRSALIKETN